MRGNIGLTLNGDGQGTAITPHTDLVTAVIQQAVQAGGMAFLESWLGRAWVEACGVDHAGLLAALAVRERAKGQQRQVGGRAERGTAGGRGHGPRRQTTQSLSGKMVEGHGRKA